MVVSRLGAAIMAVVVARTSIQRRTMLTLRNRLASIRASKDAIPTVDVDVVVMDNGAGMGR